MQSTLSELRNSQDYPTYMTRVIGTYHLVAAIIIGLVGFAYFTKNAEIANFFGFAFRIQGSYVTTQGIQTLATGVALVGAYGMFMALLSFLVSMSVYAQSASIWRGAILLNGWFLLSWIFSAFSNMLIFFGAFFAAITLIALLFDDKVKAAFGRGALAEAYWREKDLGKKTYE